MKQPSSQAEALEIFTKGKKFKLNKASKGFKKGDRVTVKSIGYGNPIYIYIEEGTNIYLTSTVLDELPLTVAELTSQIKELKSKKEELDLEISETKDKIAFMKENGIEEFDENEFKVMKTLETLEDPKTTKLQKAKIIAGMLNS